MVGQLPTFSQNALIQALTGSRLGTDAQRTVVTGLALLCGEIICYVKVPVSHQHKIINYKVCRVNKAQVLESGPKWDYCCICTTQKN